MILHTAQTENSNDGPFTLPIGSISANRNNFIYKINTCCMEYFKLITNATNISALHIAHNAHVYDIKYFCHLRILKINEYMNIISRMHLLYNSLFHIP